jgi:hypothetical protein
MFMKLLVYFHTMTQLSTDCILMGFITYFMLEVQINYIRYLKTFTINEILCVITFYIIYSPNFP